jgi:hypothetical protein
VCRDRSAPVEMYRKWLDGDKEWTGRSKRRTSSTPSNGATKGSVKQQPASEVANPPETGRESHGPGMITYPFPIRPGIQGKVTLPEDLTLGARLSASLHSWRRWRSTMGPLGVRRSSSRVRSLTACPELPLGSTSNCSAYLARRRPTSPDYLPWSSCSSDVS